MSAYDLEEQEQLAELKAFWTQNRNLILVALGAALAVLAGFWIWQRYQQSLAGETSAMYAVLEKAAAANDAKKVGATASELMEQHPRSLYAVLAALISAKMDFDAGDLKSARVRLQWVIDNARDPEVQAIARLRLAGVALDEKAYDEALKVLAEKPPPPFEPLFDELRGDILVAQGKSADARAAYKAVLDKLKPEDEAARALVQMKLDALGG